MRTDAAVFVGDYPFRGLPSTSLEGWKEVADRYDVHRAVVSCFCELFWENNYDAAKRLAGELRDANQSVHRFTHFVVVNPAYPGQLQKVPELLEITGAPGVRLFPNYHGYRLWDERVGELFEMAKERGFAVQIFNQIQDARLHWMLSTPPMDMTDFQWLLSSPPAANVLISGLEFGAINLLGEHLRETPRVWVDLSRVRGPIFAVERLVENIGSERLLFGSLWPLQNIASSFLQIEEAKISQDQRTLLLGENWRRFASGALQAAR